MIRGRHETGEYPPNTPVANSPDTYTIVAIKITVQYQNHIDTEKLISSLLMACHQPGGKNKTSPGSSVALNASGTASLQNKGNLTLFRSENTSTCAVLVIEGANEFAAGLRVHSVSDTPDGGGNGYIAFVTLDVGGASQIVLRPTT